MVEKSSASSSAQFSSAQFNPLHVRTYDVVAYYFVRIFSLDNLLENSLCKNPHMSLLGIVGDPYSGFHAPYSGFGGHNRS